MCTDQKTFNITETFRQELPDTVSNLSDSQLNPFSMIFLRLYITNINKMIDFFAKRRKL